ncbi:hypothetical protein [Massilia sp.]|uniref:hypothetical protein n=1 Tax=Massilia sp. TaxID=1882437 RepID=UPI00289F9E49|nr:hypothetical protein [Massilia sp.]
MSEPISGTAAGVAGWKLVGGLVGIGGIGTALAAYVVYAKTKPETDQEWSVSLIATVIGSFCGGAALIKYLGIEHWVNDVFGLMGILGIAFTCGLPGWLLIRAIFKYMDKKKDADLADIVREVKEVL